jgi:hypothetical protein
MTARVRRGVQKAVDEEGLEGQGEQRPILGQLKHERRQRAAGGVGGQVARECGGGGAPVRITHNRQPRRCLHTRTPRVVQNVCCNYQCTLKGPYGGKHVGREDQARLSRVD